MGIFLQCQANPAVAGKRDQDFQTLVDGVQVPGTISILESPRMYHSQRKGNPLGELQCSAGLVYRLGSAVGFGSGNRERGQNSVRPVFQTVGQMQGVEKGLLIPEPGSHLAGELSVPVVEMGLQGQDLQPLKAFTAQGRQPVQVQPFLDEQIGRYAWLHGGSRAGIGPGRGGPWGLRDY